jgi:hypothetical protein
MGSRYRKILLENLVDEHYYGYPSLSMTDFVGERNTSVVFLTEGMKVLEELVHIARENGWLNDFVPSFRIYLRDSDRIEKDPTTTLLRSTRDLARNMHRYYSPSILMMKKIKGTDIFGSEIHTYSYSNPDDLLQRVFGFHDSEIGKHLYVQYSCTKNENDLLYGVDVYCIYVDIQYNENNSEIVRNVRKLKTKASPKNPPEKLGQE